MPIELSDYQNFRPSNLWKTKKPLHYRTFGRLENKHLWRIEPSEYRLPHL